MRKGKGKSFTIIVVALFVAACTIRFFFLPHWVTDHIDSRLSLLPDYKISYDDYSISLLTASVTLKDVRMIRSQQTGPLPFFETEKLKAGLDWKSLTRGFWVARIMVDHPRINFINSPDNQSQQNHIPDRWTDVVKELAILPVNVITVRDGEIIYHDYNVAPKVVLRMTDVSLNATNLQNANGDEKILSGLAEGSARVNNAKIKVDIQLNAFYNDPMFLLNAELSELNLFDVRDLLRAYGQFDVQQGLFSFYTEAGTRNNKVIGVVKPLIQDVTMASHQGKDEPATSYLVRPSMRQEEENVWLVTSLVNNVEEIQFEGSLAKGKTNLWAAVGYTLHNTFVEALVAMLEKSAQSADKPGSPRLSAKPEQKASKVSADADKKKGFLRKVFKKKEDRKKKSRDKD